MSIQDLKKNLDAKMKGLRSLKFGFTDNATPSFTEVADGIDIDASGVAFDKNKLAEKIELAKKEKLDLQKKKDGAIKDDEVYTGEDSTGFGGQGDKEQFILACMQAGGSLENCEKTWLLKLAGYGMTPELAKLIETLGKTKSVDTLEYRDGDLERIKNDFGVDLKPIIEKLKRVDGICANNKKLVAENKKLKDDLVGMKSIYDALQTSWVKKAEDRKLELKEVLSKDYDETDDFLKEKSLEDLESYLRIYKKVGKKDDGVKLTPEEEREKDMNDKSNGIELPHRINQGGIISDFEGYIDRKMEIERKEKFGWGKEE